jgi:threonylcarbamoyladenosine tRNA methylthiotransferase MtaB
MKNALKFAVHTLGCKLNYSESSAIAANLVENGCQKVSFREQADLYIINTCSVTREADKECRQVVRSALQRSPGAFIAVTGCYAQLKPKEISEINGVDIVLGASEKFNLVQYLDNLDKKGFAEIYSCEIEKPLDFHPAYSLGDRTRSFLKVQDGCDYNCSYCTIPLARGASRSNTIENVLKNVREITAAGIKEIVLTGVNLGDFKQLSAISHQPSANFYDLIQAIENVDVPVRFRISSIEPNLLTGEIIKWVSNSKKFVPHFHIPLQSGSNVILKKMRRRYLRELYAEKVSLIKTLMPHCCIGCDVIVGFPGETEDCFLETNDFLNALDISYLHVFTYSERDNTLAAKYEAPVSVEERRKRNRMLQILSEKKLRNFYLQHMGTLRPALLETKNKEGYLHGFTDNYIRVRVPYQKELQGSIINAGLREIELDGTVYAEILTPENIELNISLHASNPVIHNY